MFRRHHEPGLPSWPTLYVDSSKQSAYIKMRIADWVAVERARQLTSVLVFVFAVSIVAAAWFLLPANEDMVAQVFSIGLVSATAIVIGAPAIRSMLPDFLSRFVFARRVKIACTADWIAFRTWYYDNGIRISRSFNGNRISIQPTVEDDAEAKERISEKSTSKHKGSFTSGKHLSSASQLLFVIRSGSEPMGVENMQSNRRFRTLPIAGMESSVAERFVTLIEAALELTAIAPTSSHTEETGRDLDIPAIEEI